MKFWIISYFLELIILCNGINEDKTASRQPVYTSLEDWYQKINEEVLTVNQFTAYYAWELSVNSTPQLSQSSIKFNEVKSEWQNTRCTETRNLPRDVGEPYTSMVDILCEGPMFSESEAQTLTVLLFNMQEVFTETQVCLPKSLDLCLDLNTIWEHTYIKYPDGSFHQIFLRKDSPNSKRIYFEENTSSKLSDYFECFNGEPDLERIMAGEFSQLRGGNCILGFNDIFRWAWESWRLAVGNKIEVIYPTAVKYMNIGARNNGYSDMGELWQDEVEIPNLRQVVTSLNEDIKPFYELLHGVLRNVLWERIHKVEPFMKNGTIPAHLLGSMWADDWKFYEKLIIPFNEIDLDENFKKTNWTNIDMVKRADDFYSSMGMPGMTKLFWEKSLFQKSDNGVKCHGTAANMFSPDDFRMIVCAQRRLDDLYVIVHEMGHIQYYMAYEKQPPIFRNGNAALQESIGDAVFLGLMTPQHLNRLKLLPDKYLFTEKLPKLSQQFEHMIHSYKPNSEFLKFADYDMDLDVDKDKDLPLRNNIFGKSYPKISKRNAKMRKYQQFSSRIDGSINSFDLSLLLRQALTTIPRIPFAYIVDIFRWDLFSGNVSFEDANAYFWKLAVKEQGIHPPDWEDRSQFFDPGAKFHIADNTPYVRYFLASFIQAQIFHGLCLATVFGEIKPNQKLPMPLHRCDLYGSKRAGKLLQKALKIGSSQPWTEVLFILTGSRVVKADSLLLYYQPLITWLEALTVKFDLPIGW